MRSIPNILTLSRALIAIYLLFQCPGGIFLGLLIIWAPLSDFLDGFFARRYGWVSRFGASFDLITDGFYFFAAFFCFWRQDLLPDFLFLLILLMSIPELMAQSIFLLKKNKGIGSPCRFWNQILGGYSYFCVVGIAIGINAVLLAWIQILLEMFANGMDLFIALTLKSEKE